MPLKKSTVPSSVLTPIDQNQTEEGRLLEAQKGKWKPVDPPQQDESQQDNLDQEINNLEVIREQVEKRKEKMLRVSQLQKEIDEAFEQLRNITQQVKQPGGQHYQDNLRYEEQNFDGFLYDGASPLTAELQATWPPLYRPPQLLMYDGLSDPKQFLMSYEATILSYGGNATMMAKYFVMAVRSVAQTWYSSLRPDTISSWQKLKDMLLTSFQGFQTKPIIAHALFQCTRELDEYLQAYVQRFL